VAVPDLNRPTISNPHNALRGAPRVYKSVALHGVFGSPVMFTKASSTPFPKCCLVRRSGGTIPTFREPPREVHENAIDTISTLFQTTHQRPDALPDWAHSHEVVDLLRPKFPQARAVSGGNTRPGVGVLSQSRNRNVRRCGRTTSLNG